MRKRGAILLFVFLLAQAYPAVNQLLEKTNTFFVIDNEKAEDKTESCKTDKKDYTINESLTGKYSSRADMAFHLSEKIHPSPCPDQETPPPNFC